ncbi:MAG: hypothetical protein ACE5JO_12380 [Candidatus Binatia bacterium]
MKFAHAYTRFAITEYHRQGLNNPAALAPERVARYILTLRPTGAILRFDFAPDWEAVRKNLVQTDQIERRDPCINFNYRKVAIEAASITLR